MTFNCLRGVFMKKILAFTLMVIMVISFGALWGCNGNTDNTATSGSTPDEALSPLAGQWKVVSTDDEVEWSMNSQDTLHITEIRGGQRYTTVCRYSYDKDTGSFEYTCLSASGSFEGTAKPEGGNLTVVSNDGKTTVVLRKIPVETE